jgi:hypothetical protein
VLRRAVVADWSAGFETELVKKALTTTVAATVCFVIA